jgi:hypothetical protein
MVLPYPVDDDDIVIAVSRLQPPDKFVAISIFPSTWTHRETWNLAGEDPRVSWHIERNHMNQMSILDVLSGKLLQPFDRAPVGRVERSYYVENFQ